MRVDWTQVTHKVFFSSESNIKDTDFDWTSKCHFNYTACKPAYQYPKSSKVQCYCFFKHTSHDNKQNDHQR